MLLCGGLFGLTQATVAQAHGGAIITDGYTERYEWLVAMNPYPIITGQAVVTLLVYDSNTHQPVNDLTVELYLASDTSEPCCVQGTGIGPLLLTSDPAQFPGDYSTVVTLDKIGQWQTKFHVITNEGSFDARTAFTAELGNPATGVVATAPLTSSTSLTNGGILPTAVTLSLPQPVDGLAAPATPFGRYWWLWGLLALGPVIGIFRWGLRPI